MADFSTTGLRVLVAVARQGSFTAASQVLGYTQSAVSRQVAGLEVVAGRPLFERRRDGVALTPAGARLLDRAIRVLDELDAAVRESAAPSGPVRLGAFATALAGLVPAALASLPRDLVVSVREGTTPALARALRTGSLDLALVAQAPPFRPLDTESPELRVRILAERELMIAVGPRHPFAARGAVEVAELRGQVWVGGRPGDGAAPLGVWPGLAERPDVRYVVRDWFAKLQLVAAGLAITTITPALRGALPEGVRAVAVRGEPHETRRLVVARRLGPPAPGVAAVEDALGAAASDA